MKNPFEIKHIPFLQIDCPPSPYELREARKKALKKFKKSHSDTFIRWEVEKMEKCLLLDNYSSFKTLYIPISVLQEKIKQREESNLIQITHPALSDLSHKKESIKKYAGAPQFAFGGYYYMDRLFLIEDILAWSHHRIPWVEIRTAKSIVDKERNK